MISISSRHTPPAESRALEMIRHAYSKNDYVFFENRRYDLNIGGIRSETTEPERFDDSFFVAFFVAFIDERDTWRVAMWSCTTDPGLFFLNSEKMGNRAGTAVLIPDQYRRYWKLGAHGKKKYPALIQNGMPFRVWRDHNKDGSLNRSGKVYEDVTGLNCHKAYSWNKGKVIGTSMRVDNWSAGCQVSEVSYAHDYILMPLATKQVEKGAGSTFTYTLFESKDFSKM